MSLTFSFHCYCCAVYYFVLFYPLHPKISMHILHTALYTFLKVPTRRICLKIKSLLLFIVMIVCFIPMTWMFDSEVM